MEAAFSQNGPNRGSQTLEIDVQALKSVPPTLEIIQIVSFSGTQTLLRETNPRVWGGQSIPEIAFFLLKCQNRLRMSGKKWRLPILTFQPEPSISSILSVFGYKRCVDFVSHRLETWSTESKVHGDPVTRDPAVPQNWQ